MTTRFAFLIAGLCALSAVPLKAEWLSLDGNPVKWGDMMEVRLRDLHPTQSAVGFDRIFYKLGRYAKDRRKIFEDYCEKNGAKGVKGFSFVDSDLHDPKSFACQEPMGTNLAYVKTVVIGPDDKLYLTDGHHTFNAWWQMPEGGPDLHVFVQVVRDYRDYKSIDEFWKQMEAEKNIWLLDIADRPIAPSKIPTSLGLEHFANDQFRSLMYFTKRIAWNSPDEITVPDPDAYDDRYPGVPFLEFYWARELRKTVNLADYDLTTRDGYVDAIRAVGRALLKVSSSDIGGSGKSAQEMGQFKQFNERELIRIDRPGTGKLAYMLAYKTSKRGKK